MCGSCFELVLSVGGFKSLLAWISPCNHHAVWLSEPGGTGECVYVDNSPQVSCLEQDADHQTSSKPLPKLMLMHQVFREAARNSSKWNFDEKKKTSNDKMQIKFCFKMAGLSKLKEVWIMTPQQDRCLVADLGPVSLTILPLQSKSDEVAFCLAVRLTTNFAHAMTAVLSWHVQFFVATSLSNLE